MYIPFPTSLLSSTFPPPLPPPYLPVSSQNQIDMWWPNGYGDQPLYRLTATWVSEDEAETSSKSVRVGFRTVELNQEYIDANDTDKGTVWWSGSVVGSPPSPAPPLLFTVVPPIHNCSCHSHPSLSFLAVPLTSGHHYHSQSSLPFTAVPHVHSCPSHSQPSFIPSSPPYSQLSLSFQGVTTECSSTMCLCS